MTFTSKTKWVNEISTLKELSANGKSMAEIGLIYGVSRQRMKQIFAKYNIPHIGLKLAAIKAAAAHYDRWGIKDKTELYAAQRKKFLAKRSNCVRSGKVFTITFGEMVFPSHCPILGIELDYFAERTQENSPSFDQTDPGKGYVPGNVQIVSWRANRIKNDGSAEEHRLIAEYLAAKEAQDSV